MSEEVNLHDNSHVRELEEAVLCCLLVNRNSLHDVTGLLKPDMFASPGLGRMYAAILALYERGEQPDFLTTETEMRKMAGDKTVDPGEVIRTLRRMLPRVMHDFNLPAYAAEIRRQSMLRQLHKLFVEMMGKTCLPESDPIRLIQETDEALLSIRQHLLRKEGLRPLHEWADEAITTHRERREKKIAERAVLTGFRDLDSIYGGIQEGEMFVLGGRPGDGKTAIALQIGVNAAEAGKNVAFFCLEMGNMQLMNRLFTGYASIHHNQLRFSTLTDKELEEMERLNERWKKSNLQIDYTPGNSLSNIRGELLLKSKQTPFDLVLIDYLQLMEATPGWGETQSTIIRRTAEGVKQLARELNCPIVVLAQLNRECEKRADTDFRPILSDLRDSGGIEQAADVVTMVHRPERHGIITDKVTAQSLVNCCQLLVLKNRNGMIGDVTIRHNGTLTRFTD